MLYVLVGGPAEGRVVSYHELNVPTDRVVHRECGWSYLPTGHQDECGRWIAQAYLD